MFSQVSVILPIIGLMATGSLLILVMARSVCILLGMLSCFNECVHFRTDLFDAKCQ